MGYTINEDGSVTRDHIPNSRSNRNNNGDNNIGCWIWIAIIFIIGIILGIASSKSSSNSNKSDIDSVDYDTTDIDTVAVADTDTYYANSFLTISSTSVYFNYEGGSKTILVSSSDSWDISTNTNEWGHLYRENDKLILTIDANNSNEARTDYFEISSGTLTRRVNITQDGRPNTLRNHEQVTGCIRNIWVDHNVSDSYGVKGMRIHVKFEINGMLNRAGEAAAYFYYSNGSPLRDKNNSYCTSDGCVATHVNFTPNYENCTFNDLTIFMPYNEMHLSRTTSCYFTISIWNGNEEITSSERQPFDITF